MVQDAKGYSPDRGELADLVTEAGEEKLSSNRVR